MISQCIMSGRRGHGRGPAELCTRPAASVIDRHCSRRWSIDSRVWTCGALPQCSAAGRSSSISPRLAGLLSSVDEQRRYINYEILADELPRLGSGPDPQPERSPAQMVVALIEWKKERTKSVG